MPKDAFVIEKNQFSSWLKKLQESFQLIGPVEKEGHFVFSLIEEVNDLVMDYDTTMLGPRKFIFLPEEKICTIYQKDQGFTIKKVQDVPGQLLIGVHSCDLHAILVLDKVFLLKSFQDHNYRLRRENTLIMALNCTKVCPTCFCSSMGTGPFVELDKGFDFLLTDCGESYLIESFSEKAKDLLLPLNLPQADDSLFKKKEQLFQELKGRFIKNLDTTNLVQTLLENQDHPVWQRTAEERCLGCTNCTMVCPTCFCFNVKDKISFDLKECDRVRYWDSCQELHFAEVHGANYRSSRKARLRQFVTHKLATWVEQFGCFGCIGCGRCMYWCPTHIDLTEMAKEVQKSNFKRMREDGYA